MLGRTGNRRALGVWRAPRSLCLWGREDNVTCLPWGQDTCGAPGCYPARRGERKLLGDQQEELNLETVL